MNSNMNFVRPTTLFLCLKSIYYCINNNISSINNNFNLLIKINQKNSMKELEIMKKYEVKTSPLRLV